MKPFSYFGVDAYNCDAYGQYAYNECGVEGSSNDGGLSFTGELIYLPIALGGAILIASVILLVKRLRRRSRSKKLGL